MELPSALLSQLSLSQKKKKSTPKKYLIFQGMELSTSKIKKFLIFQEMELSGSNIKKFLIFSQKKAFLIFQEMELFLHFGKRKPQKNSLYFGKRKPRKNYLYFWQRNFLTIQETELSNISGEVYSETWHI